MPTPVCVGAFRPFARCSSLFCSPHADYRSVNTVNRFVMEWDPFFRAPPLPAATRQESSQESGGFGGYYFMNSVGRSAFVSSTQKARKEKRQEEAPDPRYPQFLGEGYSAGSPMRLTSSAYCGSWRIGSKSGSNGGRARGGRTLTSSVRAGRGERSIGVI